MSEVINNISDESTGMLDVMQIMERIPHRFPMLLVDRILEEIPMKRIVGIKNVTINEQFFQGHYPGHPVMPGVLIIEAMAQTIGILILKECEKNSVPYFTSIKNAKLRRPVRPGDTMRMELDVLKVRNNGKILVAMGKTYVEDKLVAEAELMFTVIQI